MKFKNHQRVKKSFVLITTCKREIFLIKEKDQNEPFFLDFDLKSECLIVLFMFSYINLSLEGFLNSGKMSVITFRSETSEMVIYCV